MKTKFKRFLLILTIGLTMSSFVFAESADGKGETGETGTSGIENAPGQNKDKDGDDTVSASDGKSAMIQLNTSINETEVSYYLDYDSIFIEDETDLFEIQVDALTSDGKTNDFHVWATSNKNNDKSVEVVVTPGEFLTTLNTDEVYHSGITPSVTTDVSVTTLTAGKHAGLLVNQFYLWWVGNPDLPAGNYQSDVQINYSVV